MPEDGDDHAGARAVASSSAATTIVITDGLWRPRHESIIRAIRTSRMGSLYVTKPQSTNVQMVGAVIPLRIGGHSPDNIMDGVEPPMRMSGTRGSELDEH